MVTTWLDWQGNAHGVINKWTGVIFPPASNCITMKIKSCLDYISVHSQSTISNTYQMQITENQKSNVLHFYSLKCSANMHNCKLSFYVVIATYPCFNHIPSGMYNFPLHKISIVSRTIVHSQKWVKCIVGFPWVNLYKLHFHAIYLMLFTIQFAILMFIDVYAYTSPMAWISNYISDYNVESYQLSINKICTWYT